MCEEMPHLLSNDGIRLFPMWRPHKNRGVPCKILFSGMKYSMYIFTNTCLVAIYPWVTISILDVHIYTCIDAPMNNELWKCVHKDMERDST